MYTETKEAFIYFPASQANDVAPAQTTVQNESSDLLDKVLVSLGIDPEKMNPFFNLSRIV